MPSTVRVTQTGDSHAMGRARLQLKLGAIGYANTRHGIDAELGLSKAAFGILRRAAVEYFKALTGVDLKDRLVDMDAYSLRAAAVAYVNARHGVDGEAGLAKAGLALLAAAAIDYCEKLAGCSVDKDQVVDPQLRDG